MRVVGGSWMTFYTARSCVGENPPLSQARVHHTLGGVLWSRVGGHGGHQHQHCADRVRRDGGALDAGVGTAVGAIALHNANRRAVRTDFSAVVIMICAADGSCRLHRTTLVREILESPVDTGLVACGTWRALLVGYDASA